jgi:hypothetical protein
MSGRKVESSRIRSLKQFEGTFSNTPSGGGPMLSWFIFGGIHDVDAVSSKVLDDSHIQVQALHKGEIVKEKVLELNKDFKISSSQIPVYSRTKVTATKGGGGYALPVLPFAGAAVLRGDLYLNKDGDLVYHTSTDAAMLVLFVVPVAGSQDTYCIFKRLK